MAIAITIPRLGWNMDEGVFVGWLSRTASRPRRRPPVHPRRREGDAGRRGHRRRHPADPRRSARRRRHRGRRRGDRLSRSRRRDGRRSRLDAERPRRPSRRRGRGPAAAKRRAIGRARHLPRTAADLAAGPADRAGAGHRLDRARRQRLHGPDPQGRRPGRGRSAVAMPHLAPRSRRVVPSARPAGRSPRGWSRAGGRRPRDADDHGRRHEPGEPPRPVPAPPSRTRRPELHRLRRQAGRDRPARAPAAERPMGRDDRIVLRTRPNIGIAVDTEAGLLVPVIRGAAELGLAEIAARARDLIARARDGNAPAGRDAGRDVHDHQPRRVRRRGVHADHQPARVRHPRPGPDRARAGDGRGPRRRPGADDA